MTTPATVSVSNMTAEIDANSARDRAEIEKWRFGIVEGYKEAVKALEHQVLTTPVGAVLDIIEDFDTATRRHVIGLLIAEHRNVANLARALGEAGKFVLALADSHLTAATRGAHALNEVHQFVGALDLPATATRVRELETLVAVMTERIDLQAKALRDADTVIVQLSANAPTTPALAALVNHIRTSAPAGNA